VAYKQAELLVQLGLTHSKYAFPAPGIGNDAGIRKGSG
jgi:allantoin racemase